MSFAVNVICVNGKEGKEGRRRMVLHIDGQTNIEALLQEARKLVALLEHPEPGIMSWHGFVHERIGNIAAFHKETTCEDLGKLKGKI